MFAVSLTETIRIEKERMRRTRKKERTGRELLERCIRDEFYLFIKMNLWVMETSEISNMQI